MTARPATLPQSSTVGAAIETMVAGGYRHLPIVDEHGTPISVAAVRGLVHYLVEHFPQAIYTLPPEPHQVPAEREGA
jgi:hypothetical protein